jgi:peptide deformylase
MLKTKLKIHTWPDKILRKRCRQVDAIDDNIREILSEMVSLMKVSDGIGLAANQVGLNLSLVVAEIDNKLYKLVNPRIIKSEGSISLLEGCLSFPGLELNIKRNKKILISAQDQEGREIKEELEGLAAIVLQHEIDHIQGVVFIDRISFWQKLKIKGKLKKISQISHGKL